MSEKPGVGGRESGAGETHGSDAPPPTSDGSRGSGVGGRESELKAESAVSPTPDTRLPTPDSPFDPRLPTPETVNWPLLYSAVLIELAILILIFYAFTKAFA